MSNAMDRGRQAFQIEAAELLEELEAALLALESSPEDSDLIGRVFRAMHTLKGSGGMFGFQDIEQFAHHIETVLDQVRDGRLRIDQPLIDLVLLGRDQIERMLNQGDAPVSTHDEETVQRLVSAFQAYGSQGSVNKEVLTTPVPMETQPTSLEHGLYHVTFKPHADIFLQGSNPLLLLRELGELGQMRVIARQEEIPVLAEMDPERCYTAWDVMLAAPVDENAIRDVFIFVEGECELAIQKLAVLPQVNASITLDRAEALIRAHGLISDQDMDQLLTIHRSSPVEAQAATVVDAAQKGAERATATQASRVSNIRIASEKLDQLVDLVGELVITQARLQQTVNQHNDGELMPLAEEMERLTNDLRETAMDMRLVPIDTLFSKFKRLVRDLSRAQGKEIALEIVGGETELDKNVIDKLNDPLIHIIRNCIDHGIEPAAQRMFSQKSGTGTIRLSAQHAGATVRIVIEDDGAGLDTATILKKAIEKGLVPEQNELSETEIHQLIFQPGFSTNTTVTALSGRGVGMDVVRRNVEALRGHIVIDSQQGRGTKMTINLPLTLGIIDGLLTRIADEYYVFPLGLVEECVELQADASGKGHRLIHLRGQAVPYVRLRDPFRITGTPPQIEQVLVVDHQGEKIGFVVDEVVGEQQIVIKSLGRMIRNVEGLSGATIMGDGNVALILDVPQLIQGPLCLTSC